MGCRWIFEQPFEFGILSDGVVFNAAKSGSRRTCAGRDDSPNQKSNTDSNPQVTQHPIQVTKIKRRFDFLDSITICRRLRIFILNDSRRLQEKRHRLCNSSFKSPGTPQTDRNSLALQTSSNAEKPKGVHMGQPIRVISPYHA